MQTLTVTFVQATFVSLTFAHIINISAVIDSILTKYFGHKFLQAFDQNFVLAKKFHLNFFDTIEINLVLVTPPLRLKM